MTLDKLKKLLSGEPAYRMKQAAQAVFRQGIASFSDIVALPAVLRERLKEHPILCFTPEKVRVSRDRSAHKTAVVFSDGKRVETVLMSPKPGLWTTCISSQVGCALRCSFCATGLMGFSRNLTAEEITDQVLFWKQYLKKETSALSRGFSRSQTSASTPGDYNRPVPRERSNTLRAAAVPDDVSGAGVTANIKVRGEMPARISNVVYMGMGEPLLNFENVAASLRYLSDPEQFGFGQRHLSISTAGIAPGMDRFASAFPQVNLALSLHAATPELRTRLVPINKAYPLNRLARSLKNYFALNRRKVFIEYTLLDGQNDRPQDAKALAQFIGAIGAKHLLHVNLIVWNPTDTPYAPSRPESARRFADILKRAGVRVTFRKNLGQDIDAACGQLVLQGRERQ